MEFSIIDLWNMMGTVPKWFGVVGPLAAAIICASGARRPQERLAVVLLGLAGFAVPVHSVYMVRDWMMFSGTRSLPAAAAGLGEVLMTAPFIVAGGIAAVLVWQSRRDAGPSRPVLFTLTAVGFVVVMLSVTGMRSFTRAAVTGEKPTGVAGWIIEQIMSVEAAPQALPPIGFTELAPRSEPPETPEPDAALVYSEFQVEKQVTMLPDSPSLPYPEPLRSANVEGEVLAQYVVDTTGRVEDGSLEILRSPHQLFTDAIADALPRMRFHAAEIGGRRVRQLVQQSIVFSLTE